MSLIKQQMKVARRLKKHYGRVSELMLMRKFQISAKQAIALIQKLESKIR